MECEKLAQEKTEMQRHYVMVRVRQSFDDLVRKSCLCFFISNECVFQYYEMSYGLNVEMHKQVTLIKNKRESLTYRRTATSSSGLFGNKTDKSTKDRVRKVSELVVHKWVIWKASVQLCGEALKMPTVDMRFCFVVFHMSSWLLVLGERVTWSSVWAGGEDLGC